MAENEDKNEDKKPKGPSVTFQVSKADKIGMNQDAAAIGESVSSIIRTLKTKYWESYIKKQKSLLK